MKIFNIELTVKGTRENLIGVLENNSFSGMIEEISNKEFKLIGQVKGNINALSNFRDELKKAYLVIK